VLGTYACLLEVRAKLIYLHDGLTSCFSRRASIFPSLEIYSVSESLSEV
jgi:hypothetical protein